MDHLLPSQMAPGYDLDDLPVLLVLLKIEQVPRPIFCPGWSSQFSWPRWFPRLCHCRGSRLKRAKARGLGGARNQTFATLQLLTKPGQSFLVPWLFLYLQVIALNFHPSFFNGRMIEEVKQQWCCCHRLLKSFYSESATSAFANSKFG